MPDFLWVLGIQPRPLSNNRQESAEHCVSRVGCPGRVLPLSPESDEAAIDYQSLEWLACQGWSDRGGQNGITEVESSACLPTP